MTAGVQEPEAKLESTRSVAESTKTVGVTDNGVEQPKARAASAKVTVAGTEATDTESVRSREGVTEGEPVGENRAKSPGQD